MQKVGTVKEIWRYPVKGMAGELLAQCEIGPNGIVGDRVWALRDTKRQEIQSCKFRPELLQCTAKLLQDGSVSMAFPNGDVVTSDHLHVASILSDLVGHESTLETLRPLSKAPEDLDYYRRYKPNNHSWLEELKDTFSRESGEPLPDFSQMPQQMQDFVTVPGTFFLVSPFHLITTASLRYLKSKLPTADWDVRRFRPNIVIQAAEGEASLLEQSWLERQLMIADVPIDCAAAAPRCGAITRKQQGLIFDKSMLRSVVSEAEQNLGVYGAVREQGEINVGDTVYLK
ncbi:MOSC domain-containing protein [Gilvimarinus polysaccharolyticus]|uniref:MOSC domain-containing protein n=1 Tax=Gilvimarinus polysaccharolyticus TaxID=863921 RepID=UPI0006731F21|nr:MOSC domain-containing protein [Gilvimarinus polysaccharolyticus]